MGEGIPAKMAGFGVGILPFWQALGGVCRFGRSLTGRITARNHVSLTGTARSAILAVGPPPFQSGRDGGKIGVNRRELTGGICHWTVAP